MVTEQDSRSPTTIIIVDDHKLVREAWTTLLNDDPRFTVLISCDSAESAIEAVKKFAPDILLLDIRLPGISGIEALPIIHQASPDSKIIVISMHAVPMYARRMLQRGARGYVTKNSSKEEMVEAILAVTAGNRFICRQIKELITEEFTGEQNSVNNLETLSERELEIIDLIRKGFYSREIGQILSISPKTVEVHRSNILKKMKMKNMASLINFLSNP